MVASILTRAYLEADRSSHRRCSIKKVFLKILQENTYVGISFLIKLQ